MKKKEAKKLYLYDDPESTIRFLETSMGDQEWRATIHVPSFEPDPKKKNALGLANDLRQKGFEVRMEPFDDGHTALHVHHLGSRANIVQLFKDYGFSKGSSYLIQNPLGSARSLIDGVGDALEYFKDPARANGAIFVSAEAFLLSAGAGNSHGNIFHLKNALQSLAGALWLSQSVAYLAFTKKSDERFVERVQDKLFEPDKPPAPAQPGWLEQSRQFLEAHPIEIGAMTNNLGMVAYMGHAWLERKHHLGILEKTPGAVNSLKYVNRGFRNEIFGALTSIGAWTLMMMPPKEYEHISDNPLVAAYQKFRENPKIVTSVLTVGASTQRFLGARDKRNLLQQIGEGLYIPGDALLMFIDNHDYGEAIKPDDPRIMDGVAHMLETMPLVMSPDRLERTLRNTAKHVADELNALREKQSKTAEQPTEPNHTDVIYQALKERVESAVNQQFHQLIGAARHIAMLFPNEDRAAVTQQLAETVSQMQGVDADTKDILRWISAAYGNGQAPTTRRPATIEQLQSPMELLAQATPEVYHAHNLAMLHQALGRMLQPSAVVASNNATLANEKVAIQNATPAMPPQ